MQPINLPAHVFVMASAEVDDEVLSNMIQVCKICRWYLNFRVNSSLLTLNLPFLTVTMADETQLKWAYTGGYTEF